MDRERGDGGEALPDATAGARGRRARAAGSGGAGRGGANWWKRLPFWLRLLVLAVAAFMIGMVSVNYIVMPVVVHGSKEIKVPVLTGLPLDEARSALEEKGLLLQEVGSVSNSEIPEGRVVKQEPEAGASVRKARSVSVVLSKGPDMATVPRLEGESLRHADILLARLGLGEGTMAHSFSPEVPADYVIGTDPPAGASLHKGSPVSLLVSLGPEEDDFVMPDLRGLPLHETARALEGMGFNVRVIEEGSSSPSRGRETAIEKQRPLPGKRVRKGDEIELSS